MCVSLFSKSQSFLIKLLVRASLHYCIMDNTYKKHFFTGALKNLLKFLKQFQKKIHAEAAVLRCLQDRCPEKIRKLYKEVPVLESLFKKVSRNKETPAQVFSCEFCEAFKSTIFTEHFRYEVGNSLLKCFTFRSLTNSYLIVWSFSMLIAKTICVISISCFSIFSITIFFY